MNCPYCDEKMIKGSVKCYRCAPTWKGEDGKKFSFGKGKLFMNTTEEAWYCEKCDCLIIKPIGEKIKIK